MDENKIEEKVNGDTMVNNKKKTVIILFSIFILLILVTIFSTIFSLINFNNENIVSGVKIQGIDVSGLSKEDAISKLTLLYDEKKKSDLTLKYEDYETSINSESLGANYNIEDIVSQAVLIGKDNNIFVNNYNILFALLGKKDLTLSVSFDEESTNQTISGIVTNLPDAVVEPSYYIENNTLIITKGKEGLYVDTDNLIEKLKISLLNYNSSTEYIKIPVITKLPEDIDIEKIYSEVHKEVQDAYYEKDPFTIHPEVQGVDFDLESAKTLLQEDKEKYEIPLVITNPKVTTAQIGSEAFPDLLGTYPTRYDASDVNRTTNLRLAVQKINEKVVLPGETFSYNQTLGERTVAAGYKNAKVYENGQVVDGIGGGICQISSTLYNAVLLANLDIVSRTNHQFVTSYTPPGRDATVVYGLTDFKFKNSRKYAIKIKASLSNGIATVSIYGIKEEAEYSISFRTTQISTIPYTVKYIDDNTLPAGTEKVTQKGANGQITETYIIKSLNGKVVSTKLLSKDTYNAMQRIILRGTKTTSSTPTSTTPTPTPENPKTDSNNTTPKNEENTSTKNNVSSNTTNTNNTNKNTTNKSNTTSSTTQKNNTTDTTKNES